MPCKVDFTLIPNQQLNYELEVFIASQKSRASNLIVSVESEVGHNVLRKNIEKRELEVACVQALPGGKGGA